MRKLNIVYACYGKAGLDCLYRLLSQKEVNPYNIVAVTYNSEENQVLIKHLQYLKIPCILDSINGKDAFEYLRRFQPDYLFSVYYRDIIQPDILNLIKTSSVNLHPSLLPEYRGCFSAPWVLINGENKTGITYHLMDSGIDTGNIILQRELVIMPWDTGFSLFHRLIGLGAEYFAEMFQKVVRNGETGIPQTIHDHTFKRKLPYNGYIDLGWPKDKIERFIRAMYFPPFDGAKLKYNEKEYQFMTMDEFERFCSGKDVNCE